MRPTVKLGSAVTLIMGQAPAASDCNKEGNGTPFVKVGEFGAERPIIREWTTDPRKLAQDSDVLICVVGATCGKINLGANCAIGRSVAAIRPRPDKIDQRYLWYFMQGKVLEMRALSQGAAQTVITREMINGIGIHLPRLEEQRRIVAVLDDAFAAIATATANAEKNLANARALFDAELRAAFEEVDPECPRLTLSDASIDFGRGKSKHRPRNDPSLYGGPYPFIQTGDVRNCDHLITEYSQTYNEKGLAQSKLWPRGTICITIAANIAETGILDFDACFPDSVIGMVVDPAKSSQHYVEYLLQSLKTVLQAKGKGSAQANINLATFENERFPFPSLRKQQDISDRLDTIAEYGRSLEATYQRKLEALESLRKSLLHRAFSGELTEQEPLAA